jgi:hypothetical protein
VLLQRLTIEGEAVGEYDDRDEKTGDSHGLVLPEACACN